MSKKISKGLIDRTTIPAGKTDHWLWDTEVKGFGVRIQSSDRKTYVVRYRTHSDLQRKQTIGRCSDMPPEKARDLARKIFTAVAEGKDPMHDRIEKKGVITVAELKDRYMEDHAKPFKKPSSVVVDETNWRLHILPQLGKKKVSDVSTADILKLVGSMSVKPAIANQCLALLSKTFNLAELWSLRPKHSNPCQGVKKFTLRERETILSPEEIGRLFSSLDTMAEERRISDAMANLIRLLMLTGCRLREVMHAKQEWVDKTRCLLVLPDSKTGQRKIALSQAAMAVIEAIPEGEWLIPGQKPGQPMQSPRKHFQDIKAHAELPEDLRLHDLRHTAGSIGHMAGLSQRQIATMLGHRNIATTARYLHGTKTDGAKSAEVLADVIGFRPPAVTSSENRPVIH